MWPTSPLLRPGPRSILGLGLLASAIVGLLLAPGEATAEVRARWHGEPACVATDELGPRIAALTGSTSEPASLSLSAERSAAGWRIALTLDGSPRPPTRTLEGRDCGILTEAVALVVAVQLDAMATSESVPLQRAVPRPSTAPVSTTTAPSPLPSDSTPTAPVVGESRDETRDSRGPRRRPPRLAIGAAAAAELGVLPRGAASFELDLGPHWRRSRLELGALVSVGPDAVVESMPSVTGRFRLATGLARGCGVLGPETLQLPLCAAMEAGVLRAESRGLARPEALTVPWLASVFGARPRWRPARRLALGGNVDVVVPWTRHRFTTGEGLRIHAVPPLAVRFGLALELLLP